MSGWIGVDLDGTLAEYGGWISEQHIGEPVPAMAFRVRKWLADGKDVRIFTARVDGGEVALAMGNEAGAKFRDVARITSIIQDWTEKHFGARLPVTNRKDYGMVELWDDRAVQIEENTGRRIGWQAVTSRIFQPDDPVEWIISVGKGDKIVRGVVESIGRDKNEGLAMVREIGQPKSRPISLTRLRDRKTHVASVPTGGEVA